MGAWHQSDMNKVSLREPLPQTNTLAANQEGRYPNSLVKKYLPVKYIGGRIYVERDALDRLLSDPDRDIFSLK